MLLRRDRALLALDIALDVAFHTQASQAQAGGAALTGAAEIAARLGQARRGIEPLLQALVRAGVLDSVRGPRGGYRLARPARELPLTAVTALCTEEEPPPPPAGRLAAAVSAPLWSALEEDVQARLGTLTLADLLERAARAGLRPPAQDALDFVI